MIQQSLEETSGALRSEFELEFIGNGVQYLLPRQGRICQVDGLDLWRESLHEDATEHGLAAANFPANLDNALVVANCVEQGFKRCCAIGATEEEIGMRRDAERRLIEAEVAEVHSINSPWIIPMILELTA